MWMDTYPCIAMFACPTETVGQWCLLIFVLSMYIFLKQMKACFIKKTVESFCLKSFQIYAFYRVSFNLK